MPEFYVVVDNLQDWSPYYPSQDVISIDDYLNQSPVSRASRVRVINLSRHYKYLSSGYYCSLLAEARGHHVLPSVRVLSDLGQKSLAVLQREDIDKQLARMAAVEDGALQVFRCWFGQCLEPQLLPIAREFFERYPCPILEVTLEYRKGWSLKRVKPASLRDIVSEAEQEGFANAFEKFSTRIWRKPKARKNWQFDLAILVNPEEEMPPSDSKALKRFIRAANQLGMAADLITREDYQRLPEYDGLFIRETTAVNHHTYRFAKKAEAEGLVVIDDPTSILRCTNKVYLADLLKTQKIATPKTELITNYQIATLEKLVEHMGFPLVLKVPDGSFSRGVVKVENMQQLLQQARTLMQKSAILLAQEFMYTQYDWRIGVLNHKPLYACRYYMVDEHWQIYQHGDSSVKEGGFETLATFEVPKQVLNLAVKSTRLMGDGLYGVDIKQGDKQAVVIEINDNPSIDSGVEDKYLGEQLYVEIMSEFQRRMMARRVSA